MKALTLIFVVLIALLQYPLWLGKGSWMRVWDLSRQISQEREKNNILKARNETLDAEVMDLKSGRAAIEERARTELGMVKKDEVFYQVLENTVPIGATPLNPKVTATEMPKALPANSTIVKPVTSNLAKTP